MHQEYIVSNFYKFLKLNKIDEIKIKLKNQLINLDIKGSFLIGNEGINGSFSVKTKDLRKTISLINSVFNEKFKFKLHSHNSHAFLRLKIKIKKEIVTIGKKSIQPFTASGQYLSPKEWEEIINCQNVIMIDTRNHYESSIGSFSSSIKVNSNNFKEFPAWFDKNKKKFKNKKIAMFCTGGIRCEKATNYVMKSGFKDVFQLEGGIINYLEKTKNSKKLWEGDCFVFDDRVSVNKELEKSKYDQCYACRYPLTKKEMLSKLYVEGVSCPKCFNLKSDKQKRKYKERQKQINIAKKKGIKHLGY